jgi:ribokinase
MSGRVIVVGSVNIDLVPHPGETVVGGTYDRHHGGKGGNQAVAAARLRRPTLFIGAAGDDVFEAEARRALSAEKVDVSMLASLPGHSTGVALILVDESGENEIAVVPGANGAIEPGYVRECLSRLGRLGGDALLVCNEVPLHVVREALVCARAAGATTILNPAPATGIDRSLFALADIITPNRNELALLLHNEAKRAGHRPDAGADIPARARALLEHGPDGPGVRRAVIVTLGASGVLVLERAGGVAAPAAPSNASAAALSAGLDGCDEAEPTPKAEAVAAEEIRVWEAPAAHVSTVDSTGAGDAFNGALAAALAEGRTLVEAVRRALAAGALATTRVGAREGMPTATELEEFLAAR